MAEEGEGMSEIIIDVGNNLIELVGCKYRGELVRCKECKHNYNTTINHGKMCPRCDFTDWKLSENDYCSRGEREGE